MASRRNQKQVDSGNGSFDPLAVLRKIELALAPLPDTPEVGEMTPDQWAEAWGISATHARRQLANALAAGVVAFRFLRCADGRKRSHYREKIK